MNIISKELIPNKEWILKIGNTKVGSVSKNKKGYNFLSKGKHFSFKELTEIGIDLPEKNLKSSININQPYQIYEYPCSNKPFEPIYNIKKKLPIFAKSSKSKSLFCAGYYIIKFRKGWVKSFCPKLITLERYEFFGPFKNEQEMKQELSKMNKNETD